MYFFLLSNVVFSKQPQPNPQFPCTNCIFYKTFSQRSPLWLRDLNYITCSVTELCLTLCDPMDYSLPGSSIHGILQARILEWVAMPSSTGSSCPRNRTCVSCSSCIAGGFFTTEPPGKPKMYHMCA